MLAAEDLTVELGGLPVLRGVAISVRAGEAVALLGGNGSGKSTLVRTLLGLLPHQRGTVRSSVRRLRDFRIGRGSAMCHNARRRCSAGPRSRKSSRPDGWHVSGHFRPLSRADRVAVREAIAHVGLSEQLNADIAAAVRWAAATGPDCPGACG